MINHATGKFILKIDSTLNTYRNLNDDTKLKKSTNIVESLTGKDDTFNTAAKSTDTR